MKLQFIDSFSFLSTSLEKLVNFFTEFPILSQEFPQYNDLKLLTRKGVFPYSWVDKPSKLDYPSLPPIEDFYDNLSKESCSNEDYEHAQKVWKHFKCKTFKDYHDLYLKTDVLLLADVFETFRTLSLNIYGLDPAWYISAPGLSWDAMLKHTEVNLELISDPDMYLFYEKGIRGGISMISKRYARVNNKFYSDYNLQN